MRANVLMIFIVALTTLLSCNNSKEDVNAILEIGTGGGGGGGERQSANLDKVRYEDALISAKAASASISIPDEIMPTEEDVKRQEPASDKSKNIQKKIIKDGEISLKTKDIVSSKKALDNELKKLNAYYEVEDLQNRTIKISYDLKIRVPAVNFEKLIANIENGKDEIQSKSIEARDVTEEYYDIETRLKNKLEYLKRYKELLAKANSVKDILEIEENIRNLQEEIESKEGRLKYLSDQVSFSTLDINLFQEKEYIYKPTTQDNFLERVKKSFSNGWSSAIDFVLGVFAIWPLILIGIVVFLFVRRIIKNRRKK
jgi:hypothetical protein